MAARRRDQDRARSRAQDLRDRAAQQGLQESGPPARPHDDQVDVLQHGNFDAEAMEGIGWFVEGVAVLASGQADKAREARARQAVTSGQTPETLAVAWSGPYRYAVSGTLVRYVDATFGRATVRRLLSVTGQQELLTELGLSESELLLRWREFVLASQGSNG